MQTLPSDPLTLLEQVGAIITDSHFVYTSGLRRRVYVNKAVCKHKSIYHSGRCSFLFVIKKAREL